MIKEHEIGHQNSQLNNQSSSYHGSSKTNVRNHSKRLGLKSKSRHGLLNRSSANKNKYRTQNFLNQTMTQINKGKDRELNPLYNRRNAALSSLTHNKLDLSYGMGYNPIMKSMQQQ